MRAATPRVSPDAHAAFRPSRHVRAIDAACRYAKFHACFYAAAATIAPPAAERLMANILFCPPMT